MLNGPMSLIVLALVFGAAVFAYVVNGIPFWSMPDLGRYRHGPLRPNVCFGS